MHVILVEDEEALRSSLQTLLEMEGYSITTAANTQEALELAEHLDHAPDLLVADVILPGDNGIELGEALRRRWPDLEVIYVSGYSPEVVKEHGELTGKEAHFLSKPVPPDRLLEMLESFRSS